MSEYQVLARRFRPHTFASVLGQAPTVTTLKHALEFKKIAQAYLFCGTRGTGKTTLARLFSMALNCPNINDQFEPCGTCPSCKEIARGEALDVLEIDGASHRGIEDIRQINESIRFSPAKSKFKIYLIDEVHMLTKEAFNALLKTLEEPPSYVKFLFATTEVEKIPATILSRCQKFQLRRIEQELIVQQIGEICKTLEINCEASGAHLIAARAEGSLRDALSLLDQILAFDTKHLTEQGVRELLGLCSKEVFETLDLLLKEANYAGLFELVHNVFHSGKNPSYFLQELTYHFRTHLQAEHPPYPPARLVEMLEKLLEAQKELKGCSSERICIEMTLMQLAHCARKLSQQELLDKLHQLEERTRHIAELPQMRAPPPAPKKEIQQTVPLKEKALPKKEVKVAPLLASNKDNKIEPATEVSQSHIDTLMQFTAKELNASLKKI
jgi:DNA polymerase III subunit gamma/tau